MAPIVALLIIAGVSMAIIRIGTLALVMTGLSEDTASFQAQSAFFGVGYTTREAELVVNHPVRRRIIRDLMIAGNIGLPTALAAGVVGVLGATGTASDWALRLGVLATCLVLLVAIWNLAPVRWLIDRVIRYSLRRAGVVNVADYDLLLHVQSGFGVAEVKLESGNRLCGLTLAETRLRDRGVVVLGIVRGPSYIGVPKGDNALEADDLLIVYGREADIRCVFDEEPMMLRPQVQTVASPPA